VGVSIKIAPSIGAHAGRSFLFFWYPVGALSRPCTRPDAPVSIRAWAKWDLVHGNENRSASPEDQTKASLARTKGPARTAISRRVQSDPWSRDRSSQLISNSEFGSCRNIRIRRNVITSAGRRAMAHKGNYGWYEQSRQFLSKRCYLLSAAICARHKYSDDNQITYNEKSQVNMILLPEIHNLEWYFGEFHMNIITHQIWWNV